jgi:ribosome-associated translation inhibitor RaiA
MRLEIRRRGVKATEELRIHVKERLRLSLGRFARHIGLVRMYLRDVNGTRGGLSKKCRIVVELPPRGRVVVTGANNDIFAAIAGTATRAGFAVKRHVKRRRAMRRAPRRPAGREPLMAALAHVATAALPEASGSNGGTRDDPRKGGG